MRSITNRTAVLVSTAGLLAGSSVLPSVASAAPTECEAGHVKTTFSQSSVASSKEAVGSVTLTNMSGSSAPVTASISRAATTSATVSGSVSVDSILVPLKAEISASASASESWTSGATIGPAILPAGSSLVATYGFNTVSFSGSQRTCQGTGQFGPSTSFSGTAPIGTYVDY